MRWANRRDANEPDIVDALRSVGAKVASWGSDGAPDLVVAFRDQLYLIEVKEGNGTLTDKQIVFHKKWAGYVDIVRSPLEALRVIGAVTAEGLAQ